MASKAIGFLNFKFGADLSGFERAMKKAQKGLKKFGKNIQKTGKSLTMGLTLPLVGLGIASIKAFDEQQKAIAQVEAGLKSTGNQVGITSEKLQQMAADLQKTSLFGDEQILSDVTAQLLTFTGIATSQFGEAQLAVVNLSTKLKTDLKSTAIMVGKALNDPITQLSALSRNGVKFTKDQTALIKSLVEMGDTAGAQTIILKELETQFGGSAAAAAAAGMGPIQQLQMQLSDLSEQIGERLIPYVKSFATWIKGLADKFDGLSESQKDNIVKWGLILAAVGPVLIIIGKMSIGISALIPLVARLSAVAMANPYILLAAAIAAVAYAVYDMTSAMNYQIDVEKEMGQLRVQAEKSITKDLVNIEKLTGAIKNETTSLDDKLIALETLKKTYPGYYDAIDETTLSTQYLDAATETLTTNLMKVATLTAYEDKLVEIRKKMLDLENTKDIDFSTKFYSPATSVITKLFGPGAGIISGVITKADELQTTIQKDIDLNEYEQLEKLLKKLSGETVDLEKEVDKINKTFKKLDHNTEEVVEGVEEIVTATEDYSKALDPLVDKIKEYADVQKRQSGLFDIASYKKHLEDISKMWQDGGLLEGPENMLNWTEKLTKAQEAHNATMELMEDIMFSAAMSAANSQQKFFDSFIENIKKAIKQLIIQLAVLTVIALLLGGPTMTIGKAFGIAKGKVLGLEGFADGGLVYGPTTALIGEGVGTTASNPEVVAPLDKLKQYMGGGNQNIIVEGILKGNDIYLSNKNTSVNRLRTT